MPRLSKADLKSLLDEAAKWELTVSEGSAYNYLIEELEGLALDDRLYSLCVESLTDALAKLGVQHRTHRQEKEKAESDGYHTRYEHINRIDFKGAWKNATGYDGGLPKDPPKLPDDGERAIVTLARRVEELEYEWS
jgi:hypothetical protein